MGMLLQRPNQAFEGTRQKAWCLRNGWRGLWFSGVGLRRMCRTPQRERYALNGG
jgi:hypothetical protein